MPKLKAELHSTWETTRELFLAYRNSRREYRRAGVALGSTTKVYIRIIGEAITTTLKNFVSPTFFAILDLGSLNHQPVRKTPAGGIPTLNDALKRVADANRQFHLAWQRYEVKFHIFNLMFRLYYARVFRNLKENHGLNNNQIREAFGVHNSFIREWLMDEEKNKEQLKGHLETQELLDMDDESPED